MSAPSYSPEPDCLDEAYEPDGTPRPLYAGLLDDLGGRDLAELRGRVEEQVEARGLTFGGDEPITVDPVPRLIGAEEWKRLEAGLLQRARALNAFV
ncbi:MAG TPA: circularly permuted type 2 ATP-grasp protein, partial [Solirubrobacterales bacterium]|nr:circularly permuted type 2 ATP-grasp protein [Solirubrobacterales bacterium]